MNRILAVFSITVGAVCCTLPAAAVESADRGESASWDIGFVGLHGGVYDELLAAAKPLGLRLRYFEEDEIASRTCDFSAVRVLYIQHTRSEEREALGALLRQATVKNPQLKVIVFMPSSADLLKSVGLADQLTDDAIARRYYGSTTENLRRLLVYTAATYLGRDLPIEPPQEVERHGFYHPDHADLFATAEEFLVWKRAQGKISPRQPRLLIAVHSTGLFYSHPRVIDALIRAAEQQGAIAGAIIDGRSKLYDEQALAFAPQAVIHTCHSMDSMPLRLKLDVPHLHSIFIRKQSISQWQESVTGLAASELAFHVIGQELIGGIEPEVTSGTTSGGGSAQRFEPIPDRIEHLVRRAMSYARLGQTSAPEKKVAIIYYDREMGKGELMRGSATGMHMNGPRSLLNVLAAMQQQGYAMKRVPKFEDELLQSMIERGRLIGVWAPADLDRLVRTGSPVLIPAEQYQQWYEQKVPEDRRKQADERWGPPPGRFMVWEERGKKYLVVPRIELGNVILLPQPLRGELQGKDTASRQAHDKISTPPHNYLATYFWLQEGFRADAVVHFGTHGSEFALPGKPNGMARRDWCDIIMGAMPNFNPWIIENMVESSPVRRRVYGTLISHLSPPIVNGGLSDELANLHELVDKWGTLEAGALKEKFRLEIAEQTRQCRLEVDLKMVIPTDGKMTDADIDKVGEYLHDIQEETTPTSLHVFGERPRADLLIPYMVNILRAPFLRALGEILGAQQQNGGDFDHRIRPAAEQLVGLVLERHQSPTDATSTVLGKPVDALSEEIDKGLKLAVRLNQDFAKTTDEIDNLLRGLAGKFIEPGPGNNPMRNPNSVPTGRNMYLLNPDEVPTRPSWELGKKLVDEVIAQHQALHGEFPTKLGFDLRSSATFRDYGVMEAQILYAMGIEPIWDDRQLVHDVKLISRESLGRPRIDVFIAASSWYESNLPNRLNLWDKAVRLAAEADEPDNPINANTRKVRDALARQGMPAQQAETLSVGRIFGRAPGRETGTSIGESVARSGDWNSRDEIAAQYLASEKHVFTEGAWGEKADSLYDQAIQGTHTVVRSWSDAMTSPLSSQYTWMHGGSLSLAVETMTGKRPDYVFSDVRDPDKSGIIGAEDALRREFRVRLFNRKWLEGMMKEGYAGADHIRVLTSNSFGWEVMRPGIVGKDNWDEMKRVLIDDKLKLNLQDWFERSNPYAYQDATAVMLEAYRKGYWQADDETIRQVAAEYAGSVARHGLSGHMTSGGNAALDQLARRNLEGLPGPAAAELLQEYGKRIDEQTQVAVAEPAPVAALQIAPVAGAPATSAPGDSEPGSAPAESEASVRSQSASDSTAAADPGSAPAPDAAGAPADESPAQGVVTGRKLEPQPAEPASVTALPVTSKLWWIAGGAAVLFFYGLMFRRRG
ncbi:MAG: cobaltochelatase subunit CobN [Pirellulales bacterium]|nr:cobaltochelatase subunit CobN [Pirellulales bacterium]